MATMYSPLTYAQTAAGQGYTKPPVPSTFVAPAFTPPGWSPYSANAADRTQYWEDTAGTMTLDQVLTATYGANGPLMYAAEQAIGAGLTISLSGTITLAPTLFPTDPATDSNITKVVTTLTATGTFPGGGSTFPMIDSTGTWHTFDATQYKAVGAAISGYVAALTLIIAGNPLNATSLPSSSVQLTV